MGDFCRFRGGSVLLQHEGQFGVVEENHVMDSILDDKKEPKALTQEKPEGVGWRRDHGRSGLETVKAKLLPWKAELDDVSMTII